MCTAALYPYPFYNIGKAVVVPLAFHAALSVFFAATVFPSTVTAQYTTAIRAVLEPLDTFLQAHRDILKLDPSSPEFAASAGSLRGLVNKSEGGLAAAGVWFRLLQRDIVYGRFAPADVGRLQWWVRRIVTRAEGMNIYFTLIEPTREKFPITPAPTAPGTPRTVPATPVRTREPSPVRSSRSSATHTAESDGHGRDHPSDALRSPSITRLDDEKDSVRRRKAGIHGRGRERGHEQSMLHVALTRRVREAFSGHGHHKRTQAPDSHDHHLHLSLLQFAHALTFPSIVSSDHLHHPPGEAAVGVYESQRYVTLEATRLTFPNYPELTDQFTKLLGEACDELLDTCRAGLEDVQRWLAGVRSASWGSREKVEARRKERLECMERGKRELDEVIERFRKDKRWVPVFQFSGLS